MKFFVKFDVIDIDEIRGHPQCDKMIYKLDVTR